MTQTIRLFMLLGAASFVSASFVHSGMFITGYEHPQASVDEGVIAFVQIVGLTLSFFRWAWIRWVGLAALGFTQLGALVGLFTIGIFSMPVVIALNLLAKFVCAIADLDLRIRHG